MHAKSMAGAALVAALSAGLGGCGTNNTQQSALMDHKHQTGAYQDWWQEDVVYHQNANVYFHPYTQTYYWFADGIWTEGPQLPRQFTLSREERTIVTREHLLRKSSNSPMVMAFNPYYVPYVDPIDPLLEASEEYIDYDAYEKRSSVSSESGFSFVDEMEQE